MKNSWLFLFWILSLTMHAQTALVSGKVTAPDGQPLPYSTIYFGDLEMGNVSDSTGNFRFRDIPFGKQHLSISFMGYSTLDTVVEIDRPGIQLHFILQPGISEMDVVEVRDQKNQDMYMRMRDMDGVGIYAAKKSEVIELSKLTANTSSNNARQVFAQVPGVNVWESDGAGIQLGIGARGLSPNRTANFNTRQNGYDMAADAIGYPESYYSPPMQAVKRVEIVRGAASLQYGTQFGGMVNFKLREGNREKRLSGQTMNTYNSIGFLNSYNELGGQSGKLNYFGFYTYKGGHDFRPNSDFDSNTGYVRLAYDFSKKLKIGVEYTHMNYLAQQPGGLTDVQFQRDPYQSLRSRNWFKVTWNLMALRIHYKISERTTLNSRTFGLISSREALGYLNTPNRQDSEPFVNRDLISGTFQNVGNETRILHRYNFFSQPSALLFGVRAYHGNTTKKQGYGSKGTDADFDYYTDSLKMKSDYDFPGYNYAAFAENIFRLSQRLSITPGLRFEYIKTTADGYYDSSVRLPLTGEIVIDSTTYESRERARSLLLAGIGVAYRLTESLEFYGNISQNYRAITFNDMRVVYPSSAVDPNLQDERGFNVDLGLRGRPAPFLAIDVSAYWLSYRNRIGTVQTRYIDNFFGERIIRLTTNVADAEIMGLEFYAETDLLKLMNNRSDKDLKLSHFLNVAYTYSYYHDSKETSVENNEVESVPAWNIKTGFRASYKGLTSTIQFTYVSDQFSDATNAETSSTGIYGIIPTYSVLDLSLRYTYKMLAIEGGVTNLLNSSYFTRRADGYPGPGIIPSSPRNIYVGVGLRF